MNYCSHCGSDRLVVRLPEGDTMERIVCEFCGTIHYQNPKMVVGCLIAHGEHVLLARRAIEPRKGLWNLPAGYLENGETLEEGARRETLEETEARVSIERLHCIYNLPHVNQIYFLFLARLKHLHFSSTTESLEVRLFPFRKIPWDDIAFSSSTFALETYLEHRNAEIPQVHVGTLNKYF